LTAPTITSVAPATVEVTPAAAPVADATAAVTAPPAATTPVADDAATTTGRRSLEDALAALDDKTKAYVLDTVKSARNEAKNLRDRAKSADDVRSELIATIAKATGIETAPPDPAALAQQLEAQTAATRQASVELAVYRAASAAGGDPNALLDSVSFVKALADVDPSDMEAVTAKVTAAVAANPALGIAPTRRAPGANPAAGSSANGAPDLESEIAAALKAGDLTKVIHLQNQKLAAPAR
jgi:hypothetical protein